MMRFLNTLGASAMMLAIGSAAVGIGVPVRAEVAGVQYIPSQPLRMMQADVPLVFIDVRGKSSFEQEHIKGAMEVSLLSLRQGNIPEIDKNAYVVTYCGCPHAMAEEAASILLKSGFKNVIVLDDGFYGWKDAGFPIETPGKIAPQFLELEGALLQMDQIAQLPPKIEAMDPDTGQMELTSLNPDGSFTMHMPYYGTKPEQLQFSAGEMRWTRRFEPGTRYQLAILETDGKKSIK